MLTRRVLTDRLKTLAAGFPAVAVAGARQVGKTTLLREVFPSAEWLQFDPVQDVGNAPADPDLFLRNLSESLAGRVVFLDLEGFCLAERAGRSVDAAWLPAWIEAPEALTAQEVNASQLGRDIGVTPQTARRWLDLLSATFQWCEVPAYSGNAVKRVSGKPKGYLADTGLACHAQAISSPAALIPTDLPRAEARPRTRDRALRAHGADLRGRLRHALGCVRRVADRRARVSGMRRDARCRSSLQSRPPH